MTTTVFSEPIGKRLRVVIVDDHELIREGLKRVIEHEHDMEVVGEAQNGDEAIRAADALQPTIMLVDVSMPGMSGVEVTRLLRSANTAVRVIGVTRHREPGFVSAMLDAGASGYVLKQSSSDELIRAVRSVGAGEQYLDRALTRVEGARACDRFRLPSDQCDTGTALNDTEMRVLRLVAGSQSNHEIAQQLSISAADVCGIKSDAMQKAGLTTRVQVVEYVRACGGNRR